MLGTKPALNLPFKLNAYFAVSFNDAHQLKESEPGGVADASTFGRCYQCNRLL
jgi:hypothetical protein